MSFSDDVKKDLVKNINFFHNLAANKILAEGKNYTRNVPLHERLFHHNNLRRQYDAYVVWSQNFEKAVNEAIKANKK